MSSAEALARFTLEPLGPFSLREAAHFWGGFTPAAHAGFTEKDHLHMAFPIEAGWALVGVCVREQNGSITADVYAETPVDLERVRQQTARILSLDIDGRAFPEVGVRDPVIGALQRQHPGLRPVCFYSPYEAATWAIISHRIHMQQASAVKARLADALGETVSIHGESMQAFPGPQRLLELQEFRGLFGAKPANLRAIALAALNGDLDAAYLRSLPDDQALASLRQLPGIGVFGAQLILLRGAGHPDYLTLAEPRVRHAVTLAYGLDHEATDADLERISEAWRPYRMWTSFLLRQDHRRA